MPSAGSAASASGWSGVTAAPASSGGRCGVCRRTARSTTSTASRPRARTGCRRAGHAPERRHRDRPRRAPVTRPASDGRALAAVGVRTAPGTGRRTRRTTDPPDLLPVRRGDRRGRRFAGHGERGTVHALGHHVRRRGHRCDGLVLRRPHDAGQGGGAARASDHHAAAPRVRDVGPDGVHLGDR